MKFVAILLSFCLSLNILAASGTVQELERHLDDYQFAMTVEWDQKDQKFHEAKTLEFFSKMESLMSEQGLSKKDIEALVDKKVADKKSLAALKLRLELLKDVNSAKELAGILKEESRQFYGQGASWNGDVSTILIGAVLIAFLGYAVWFSATHECIAWEERYECNTTTETDYYGNSYSDTHCGYEDYCTQYQKKK